MSGHSKWATIKRDKGLNDAKKGATFTKMARIITLAAKNGGDPNLNSALFFAIEKAKESNMPNDNISRAIKKGTGEDKSGTELFEISYEGYGPGGVAMIVDVATDNKNRTGPEVRKLIESTGGTIAEGGAVAWQFDVRGLIVLPWETPDEKLKRENAKWNDKVQKNKINDDIYENLELELIDISGVIDIQKELQDNLGSVEVLTSPEALGGVRKFIEDKNVQVDSMEIIKIPKNPTEVNEELRERILNIIEQIEEHEDVQNVWTSLN